VALIPILSLMVTAVSLLIESAAPAGQLRTIAGIVTIAAAGFGVVGGLAAARLFASSLGTRVDALHENAQRLAQDRPLLAASGSDEIGALDEALHEAAGLLATRARALREASEEIDHFFLLSLDLQCIAGFDGYFKRVNAAWTDALGWTPDELMARPYVEFIHPEDLAATNRESASLSAGAKTMMFENRYRTKAGSYRWLEWKASPVVGRALIYASARDITDQRASAQLLQEARGDAERANQAKNEFLSRMSHDLRTPLNAILGFAQLLETDPLQPDQRAGVRQILRGGRHLLELINEILELARIESGRLALSSEPVAIDLVVQEAIDLVRPLAAERTIEINVGDTIPQGAWVRADRQRLRQVLLNILSNAVKYNREGGRIAIAWQEMPGGQRRVSVTDTGHGIRPEQLHLLFQPFERLGAEQSTIEGTGLGLTVAKGLVEAMGGTMGVESVVDRGTTFWFELAPSEAPRAQAGLGDRDQVLLVGAPGVTGTVLYIEDNPSNRDLMQHIFARRPEIQLTMAEDGERGLDMARTLLPNLILLDLHLPGMSGEDLLRHLWATPETRGIPVIVLSADATQSQQRRLIAAGASSYLTKPLEVARVLDVVDEQLIGVHAGSATPR